MKIETEKERFDYFSSRFDAAKRQIEAYRDPVVDHHANARKNLRFKVELKEVKMTEEAFFDPSCNEDIEYWT